MTQTPPASKNRPSKSDTQIIGFRLPKALALAVKAEAVRRDIPLNHLFAEMWEMYQRAKTSRKD